jgi:hypothetical protein
MFEQFRKMFPKFRRNFVRVQYREISYPLYSTSLLLFSSSTFFTRPLFIASCFDTDLEKRRQCCQLLANIFGQKIKKEKIRLQLHLLHSPALHGQLL